MTCRYKTACCIYANSVDSDQYAAYTSILDLLENTFCQTLIVGGDILLAILAALRKSAKFRHCQVIIIYTKTT